MRGREMKWVRTLVLLTVLASVAVGGHAADLALPGHQGEYLVLEGVPADQPITLQTRFVLESNDNLEALWLAGLSESAEAPPTMLSIVWTEDRSGWFPVWGVQLASDADLFAPGVATKNGAGRLAGSKYLGLTNATPKVGHVYQVELSYDPVTGTAAVGMSDLTDETRLFTRSVSLKPTTTTTLYPAVGKVGGQVTFEEINQAATRVPLGAQWDLMFKDGDRYTGLALYRLTPSIEMAFRMGVDATEYNGEYVVTAVSGDQRYTLARVPGAARSEEVLVPFKASELPLGDAVLNIDYMDEFGKMWSLGTRSLLIVAATLEISLDNLRVEQDAIHGTLNVRSQDETLTDLPVALYAAVAEPNAREGDHTLILETVLSEVSHESTEVAFAVPLDSDRQLFTLLFDVQFGVPVGQVMRPSQFHVLRVE